MRRLSVRGADVVFPVAALAAGAGAGVLLAVGHVGTAAACCAAPLLLLGLVRLVAVAGKLLELNGSRALGTAWILLVGSTFVWRVRTTSSLDSNPLDPAALFRVGLVAAAAVLLFGYLVRAPLGPRLPLPVKLLLAYVAVAFLAAVGSPLPLVAAYRGTELMVGIAAIVAAACSGTHEWRKPLELMLAAIGAIIALAWIEALALPHRGWEPGSGAFGHALVGSVPSFSSNTLGQYGAMLGIWGIAQLGTARYRQSVTSLAALGGVATLLATQYRTGTIGFLLALTFVAWQRRRTLLAFAVLGTALVIVASGEWDAIRMRSEVVLARGNPSAARTLNSRLLYWQAAVPYIRERPAFGWGLNVAARDALATLGRDSTSTIHSTWIEALLGTGVVGASLLAFAYLALLAAALSRERGREQAALVGIVIVMLVRSLTGGTVELFDVNVLLFGAIALAARASPQPVREGSEVRGARVGSAPLRVAEAGPSA